MSCDITLEQAQVALQAALAKCKEMDVRMDIAAVGKGSDVDGVSGDPTGATAELGMIGLDFYFKAAMKQIRSMMAER